jgi:peroxiredoxin Q/BCP
VIGISPDTVASHKRFATKYELPFTLLADPEKTDCQLFGVWQERSMYGKKSMDVVRSTFVIDAEGIVRQDFPKVKVNGRSDAVLKAIQDAKSSHRLSEKRSWFSPRDARQPLP